MVGGRQREFDKQEVLDLAMKVFWKKGYVGSSLMDLTTSMGINKPSMYAAFGNKEQLFIQATENYIENYAAHHAAYLSAENQSLVQKLKAYLMSALRSQCMLDGPKGCYISLCVSEAASEDLPAAACDIIDKARNLGEQTLTAFLEQAQIQGELASHQNPRELSKFFMTLLHGTAAMARANNSVADLEPVIDQALSILQH